MILVSGNIDCRWLDMIYATRLVCENTREDGTKEWPDKANLNLNDIYAVWKPALAVVASGETPINGAHHKSMNKTVVWGLQRSDRMRRSLKRSTKDKSIYRKAEYEIGSSEQAGLHCAVVPD